MTNLGADPRKACDIYRAEEGERRADADCLTTTPFYVDIGVRGMIARLLVVGC